MRKFKQGQQYNRDLDKYEQQHKRKSSQAKFKFNRENIIKRNHSELTQKYTYGDKIGQGSFGQVYKIVHKQLNITRALKIIKKSTDPLSTSDTYQELQILKRLDHPNVLKIYQYFQSDTNWFIITQFFQGRQLFDEIVSQKRLTQRKSALIFSQICKAVSYIHAHNIAHRDIKPQNILVRRHKIIINSPVSQNKNQVLQQFQYEIKLIDWGLGSRSVKEMIRKCGTPQYCAPQVLEGSYGYECDLWSLGILLYVMLVGRFPFKGGNVHQTLHLVSRAQLTFKAPQWENISIQAKYLISSLIKKQPSLRLKASQILKNDWIITNIQSSKQKQSLLNRQLSQKHLQQTLLRLKQVTIDNKFQAVVINFIHNYITNQQKQYQLKKQFQLLDQNNDGVLSYWEIYKGYQKMYSYLDKNKLESIVNQIFNNIDLDGSGKIEYSQFITFATKINKKFSQKQLKQVFNLLDQDGNGRINKKQINHILMYQKGTQSQEFDQIIAGVDLDGDGSISLNQFIRNINNAVANAIKVNKKKKQASQSKRKSREKLQHQQGLEQIGKRVTRQSLKLQNLPLKKIQQTETKQNLNQQKQQRSKQEKSKNSVVSKPINHEKSKHKSKSKSKDKQKSRQKSRQKQIKNVEKHKQKQSKNKNHDKQNKKQK